jgi:hypothetical protein
MPGGLFFAWTFSDYLGAEAPRAAEVAALAASSAEDDEDDGAAAGSDAAGAIGVAAGGVLGVAGAGVTAAGGGVTTVGADSSFLPQALKAAAAITAAIRMDFCIDISLEVNTERKILGRGSCIKT